MGLHCSSRIGFLSYLYQQRHEIAYAFGLIAEIPIAMCSSDYNFQTEDVLQDDSDYASLPLAIHASEINLFINKPVVSTNFTAVLIRPINYQPYTENMSSFLQTKIFQPPRV
jgi:hypothetical protein